jgi:hypothetical protein
VTAIPVELDFGFVRAAFGFDVRAGRTGTNCHWVRSCRAVACFACPRIKHRWTLASFGAILRSTLASFGAILRSTLASFGAILRSTLASFGAILRSRALQDISRALPRDVNLSNRVACESNVNLWYDSGKNIFKNYFGRRIARLELPVHDRIHVLNQFVLLST